MVLLLFFVMIPALDSTVGSYVLYSEPKTWFEAQTYCRGENSDLATVVNLQDNDLLAMEEPGLAWIGLFDDTTQWKWSQGADFNSSQFNNWADANPNYNPTSTETGICVRMLPDGFWDDGNCLVNLPKVCYSDAEGYSKVNSPNTWSGSRLDCSEVKKELASVMDSEQNDLIKALIRQNSWIGLHRSTWTNWSDGTLSTFSNWDDKMDVYRNASAKIHCAMVDTETGKWFRGPCMTPIPFICNGGGSGHSTVAGNFKPGHSTVAGNFKPGYSSRIKLGLKTDANLNKAVVQSQILQQIRAKLEEHGLSDFVLRWTQMEGKSFDKEQRKRRNAEGSH